jgi:gentisate 1,2-dioxygenase
MAESQTPLFDALIKMRDSERERVSKSTVVATSENAPQELTPMGFMRWYTHPNLDMPALKTYMLWVQEIPVGSRSGRMRHQGGRVHYVWEGSGYTVVDGVAHEWEAGDVICLPIKPDGIIFQHYNTSDVPVKLISAELNMIGAIGVDMGVQSEVLEPAPEYRRPS